MLTEKEYRKVKRDSYSTISLFIENKKRYYLKHCFGSIGDDKVTDALRFGSAVDCILFEEAEFKNRFVVTTALKPKPQMLLFCNALVKRCAQDMDDNGKQNSDMKALITLAYNDVKYDINGVTVAFKTKTLEALIKDFPTDGMDYFKEIMQAEVHNKISLTVDEYARALRVVEILRTNNVTKHIVNLKSSKRYTVLDQLPILFEYTDSIGTVHKLKCLPDKVVVDHVDKTIKPYDLKTTNNVETFLDNYLKYKYYIQLGVYVNGVTSWKNEQHLTADSIGTDISSYEVLPMDFIVCDSLGYMNPLIYDTDEILLSDSMNGFVHKGKFYKGVDQCLTELKWHKDNNVWTITKDNYESDGVVSIRQAMSSGENLNEEVDNEESTEFTEESA